MLKDVFFLLDLSTDTVSAKTVIIVTMLQAVFRNIGPSIFTFSFQQTSSDAYHVPKACCLHNKKATSAKKTTKINDIG